MVSQGRKLVRCRRMAAAAATAAAVAGYSLACRHGFARACYVVSRYHSASAPVVSFGTAYKGPCKPPSGIEYYRDFINDKEELELMSVIDGPSSAWTRHIRRAQQFFGLVFYQTSQSVPELQPTGDDPPVAQLGRSLDDLPFWLLPRVHGVSFFDDGRQINQVQANEYLEDSGIGSHVEDPAAGSAFATLSLLEPVQLTFQQALDGKPVHIDKRNPQDNVKVLLEPRSLLVIKGESRYNFTHSIRQSRLVALRNGETLRRGPTYRRVSLTFRGIVKEERRAQRTDLPEGFVPFAIQSSDGRNGSLP